MHRIALVRSLWSKEGDHERGTYTLKTGFRPDPTVTHPSLGAIVCHDLPGAGVEIPRHVSILPNEWPARGGLLGAEYDAFKMYDPADKVPDVTPHVPPERFEQRLNDLKVIEETFAKGRGKRVETTGHAGTMERARKMMSSEQLKAFDVAREPASLRKEYGDTPFGRGCLAARRLLEVGVRCVEVTLSGWDSHANNHEICNRLKGILDPAFAALVRDLAMRDALKDTVVLCVGEFGRTPQLNPLAGRDHWPHSFSAALAGGGIRGGVVVGESDPEGGKEAKDKQPIANLHATVLKALGINWEKNLAARSAEPCPQRRPAHRGAVELMAPCDTGMMPGSARGATRSATRGSPGANYSLPWRLTGSEAQIPHPGGVPEISRWSSVAPSRNSEKPVHLACFCSVIVYT